MRNRLEPEFVDYKVQVKDANNVDIFAVNGNDTPYSVKQAQKKIDDHFDYFSAHDRITIYENESDPLEKAFKETLNSYGKSYLDKVK